MKNKAKKERQERRERRERLLKDVYRNMCIIAIVDKHLNQIFEEVRKIGTYKMAKEAI